MHGPHNDHYSVARGLLTGTWVRMVEARSSLASSILVFFGPPPHILCLLTLFPIYFNAYKKQNIFIIMFEWHHQKEFVKLPVHDTISKTDKDPGYRESWIGPSQKSTFVINQWQSSIYMLFNTLVPFLFYNLFSYYKIDTWSL